MLQLEVRTHVGPPAFLPWPPRPPTFHLPPPPGGQEPLPIAATAPRVQESQIWARNELRAEDWGPNEVDL